MGVREFKSLKDLLKTTLWVCSGLTACSGLSATSCNGFTGGTSVSRDMHCMSSYLCLQDSKMCIAMDRTHSVIVAKCPSLTISIPWTAISLAEGRSYCRFVHPLVSLAAFNAILISSTGPCSVSHSRVFLYTRQSYTDDAVGDRSEISLLNETTASSPLSLDGTSVLSASHDRTVRQ